MARIGLICEEEIRKRLYRDLVVSPILDPASQIKDCSINLRLGLKIVTPRLSEHKSIDPKHLSEHEVGKFQRMRQLSFGEEFIIHPRRLVLASTFEFISLPHDICGFVLSRSSYGRLGLVVATAIFVHPNWKGCLTLELVNEGELPISLNSGAPVAQLILQNCDSVTGKKLIDVPLSPKFKKAMSEKERIKIEAIEKGLLFYPTEEGHN